MSNTATIADRAAALAANDPAIAAALRIAQERAAAAKDGDADAKKAARSAAGRLQAAVRIAEEAAAAPVAQPEPAPVASPARTVAAPNVEAAAAASGKPTHIARRNRSTGTRVEVALVKQPRGQWPVTCLDHGVRYMAANRDDSHIEARTPERFCQGCRDMLGLSGAPDLEAAPLEA